MPDATGLPPWVHLTPGPIGTIYCAVIAGACSPPYSSAIEAIDWGQRQLDAMQSGPVRVTEDVAQAAWGSRVTRSMERAA